MLLEQVADRAAARGDQPRLRARAAPRPRPRPPRDLPRRARRSRCAPSSSSAASSARRWRAPATSPTPTASSARRSTWPARAARTGRWCSGSLAYVARERDRAQRGDRLPARGAGAGQAVGGERSGQLAGEHAPRVADAVMLGARWLFHLPRRAGPGMTTAVGTSGEGGSAPVMRAAPKGPPSFIARWDLDKTYLRRTSRRCATSSDRGREARSEANRARRSAAPSRARPRRCRDPHPVREPGAAALEARGEAPPRRRALGVAHAEAEPPEHAAPPLPRAARPARVQAPVAPPAALRARVAARRGGRAHPRGAAGGRRRGRRLRLLPLRRHLHRPRRPPDGSPTSAPGGA